MVPGTDNRISCASTVGKWKAKWLKTGRGGDAQIANLLGLEIGTVARGRQDLLQQDVEVKRVRRAGGSRKSLEKKRQK